MAVKPQEYLSVRFKVVGTDLHSLFDMLRYDRACPADELNANKLTYLLRKGGEPWLELIRFYPVGGRREPAYARWESCGWHVTEVFRD